LRATLPAGTSATVEVEVIVGSETLVALTVNTCAFEIAAGAVYVPSAVIVPTAGLTDHLRALLALLVIKPLKDCFCAGVSATLLGLKTTLGTMSETVEEAD
jgi:hypothetical protein